MHKPGSDDIMTFNERRKRQAGTNGVVLELTGKGDGFYDAFYTLDVNVGTPPTTYPLLLDTGSSDLWIATPGLASPSYSASGSSTSMPLPLLNDAPFIASYLRGSISGHIFTDTLSIGPYTLPRQALCAAEQAQDENLSLGFSGILGFGLGGISVIQDMLGAAGNAALADGNGAPIVLNLFNPAVQGGTPTQQWFALVLDRPGFTQDQDNVTSNSTSASTSTSSASATQSTPTWNHIWPARLAIGTHVDEVVHAFSVAAGDTASTSSTSALDAALQTIPLVTSPGAGTGTDSYTHWKTRLSGVTIYTDDGSPRDVHLSRGVDGGAFPVAALDCGGPNVLASRAVADAIYSIWDVNMSEDGNYYVPCSKALNITITLGTSAPIPIHPLDMSTYVRTDRGNCLGTIQVSSSLGTTQSPADIVLGISFLRNVYTVHEMAAPPSAGTSTDPGAAVPRIAIAALTNPTLALTEFQNVRVLNLTPDGAGREAPQMSGDAGESLSTVTKIMLGVGLFLGAVIIIFAARWFVLRRRFARMRAEGKLSTDGHDISRSGSLWTRDGVAGVVDVIRRKTTLRAKKRREQKQGLGAWTQVSEVGHDEGLSGAVATKSAIGHGGEPTGRSEHGSALRYAAAPTIERDRRPEERQGSGPFAGFSLWTFVGAKRLLGPKPAKGRYARTANPGLPGELEMEGGLMPPVPPIPEGLLTEDELRAQRYAAHQRRMKQDKDGSVWSDVTWIDRGDGTLVPSGMADTAGAGASQNYGTDEFGGRRAYAYPGTPNETVVGSTPGGKRNEYGFPKGQDESDDESTEKGSTLHGSPFVGKTGSREALPLLPATGPPMPTHGRTGSGGQPRHGPFPPLELHHPPRMDSSGIITSSPYAMTPAAGTNTPPAADSFNPYAIPTTIPASPQPQPSLVHPARERMTLAMEPSLSPLTEVNSSEFPSTNRASIMSTLLANGAGGASNVANRISQESGVERQNSIGAMSMESEVLVPLPISLMNLPHSASPPRVDRELLRGFDFSQPVSPPRTSQTLPVQRTAPAAHPLATSYTLPTQPPAPASYPPIVPAPVPPPTRTNNPSPPARANNPFDLLALDDFAVGSASKDSRFPSLGPAAKDSRFPAFTPAQRPAMPATSSSDSFRSAFVAVPDEAARPRLRMRATDLEPRPQSEAIGFGLGPASVPKMHEQPWMKPRSQSGGNASLPSMNRAVAPTGPAAFVAPAEPPIHDFAPPHEYRPGLPEQRTLPAMGSSQRPPPLSRTSEPASSSMGPRSRGPRPMVAGPRSSRSTGSTASAQSQHSPPFSGSRQGTNYDSPLPVGSSPSATSPGATSSSSSPPSGARAPSNPFSHHRIPSIPGSSSSSSSPSSNLPTIPSAFSHPTQPGMTPATTPSTRLEHTAARGPPSRSTTTEGDPEAVYGGMAAEGDATSQPGWREEAAKTAGFAGVGARSRFTGAMDSSPFEDRR